MLHFQFLCTVVGQLANLHFSEATTITRTDAALATTTSSNSIKDCNVCFVEASIDQLIIGEGAIYYVQLGSFTFNEAEIFNIDTTGGPSLVALPTAPIITYDGIPIGAPTMYNVFTGYRLVALTEPSGTCITSTLTKVEFASGISINIPSSASLNFITVAESMFVTSIGLPTCSAESTTYFTIEIANCTNGTIAGPNGTCPSASNGSSMATTLDTKSSSIITLSNSATHTFTSPTSSSSDSDPAMSNIAPGLSQSAKIGISIGASIIGAITLVTVGMLVWKRKARRTSAAKESQHIVELPSKKPKTTAELENKIAPQELSGDRQPELP